jgi:hypothetical protein
MGEILNYITSFANKPNIVLDLSIVIHFDEKSHANHVLNRRRKTKKKKLT